MKYIVFSALASLGLVGFLFVGCEHGALIYFETCETDPTAYEFCFDDCFETVAPYCETFCADDPTLPWCGPGTGGTGGDGGTAGAGGEGGTGGGVIINTGGTGGDGGTAGEGGTGGTVPECRCNFHCYDGNYCTKDWCEEGVCEQALQPEGTYCREDGVYGYCDSEGNCDIGCGCAPGHCKPKEHKHQHGDGHCEDHCTD